MNRLGSPTASLLLQEIRKKVKSAVPISAAMVCLNGLSTKSDKRTKKKNNPEKIVFFDIDGKIKLLLFNI